MPLAIKDMKFMLGSPLLDSEVGIQPINCGHSVILTKKFDCANPVHPGVLSTPHLHARILVLLPVFDGSR